MVTSKSIEVPLTLWLHSYQWLYGMLVTFVQKGVEVALGSTAGYQPDVTMAQDCPWLFTVQLLHTEDQNRRRVGLHVTTSQIWMELKQLEWYELNQQNLKQQTHDKYISD